MAIMRSFPAGLDRTGFLLSAGCAVHCAAMPFAAGFLSMIGAGFVASETTEALLIAVAAVIGIRSLMGGCRHHRQFAPVALMSSGFGLILTGRTIAADGSLWEVLAVVSGAVLIASAHLSNWRFCCASAHRH
jgi:hypothetical protein